MDFGSNGDEIILYTPSESRTLYAIIQRLPI